MLSPSGTLGVEWSWSASVTGRVHNVGEGVSGHLLPSLPPRVAACTYSSRWEALFTAQLLRTFSIPLIVSCPLLLVSRGITIPRGFIGAAQLL